ncbi:uncharacterized protein LOC111006933 isoform X2 [Momordica charantia]|uniref:Uncharacterized protein LOC111006933 isoform X2 n=1 Tax=Momordica charantia TaxID=3673 RepID=A0A6J1BZL7_MOMCH|nr:uncharacterized protein LOC111006933 isoform X2 [Momordica charantia]
MTQPLKKPKVEELSVSDAQPTAIDAVDECNSTAEEQEAELLALVEHRTREVQHLQHRISYYTRQLEEAEKRLQESESMLARFRGRRYTLSSKSSQDSGFKCVEAEPRPASPIHANGAITILGSSAQKSPSILNLAMTAEQDRPCTVSSTEGVVEDESDRRKRKFGNTSTFRWKDHKELIPLVRSSSSPLTAQCDRSYYFSSQHKRKMRSLAPCPVNDQLFVTSALDGMINLWQVQYKGSSASLLCTTDCMSQKQRRWPEDIAWHPDGNSLFSVYSADSGDSQISILKFNKTKERASVIFLEDKPYVKGIINSISFLPWESVPFITGGSDHAVILWSMKDKKNTWKPELLHRDLHSSAVMGVSGMQLKQIVLSAGADKRILGFDVQVGSVLFKHQLESKCMSVLPNPCDFNLFMVQTGSPEKQLRLFDIRSKQKEVHGFGWKQESSESQSALINQAWSPDGLHLTSGSADPVIHVFDIRYNSHMPSCSIKAHQKRVFKAVWLHSLPLLISISSDLNIGLHKMV